MLLTSYHIESTSKFYSISVTFDTRVRSGTVGNGISRRSVGPLGGSIFDEPVDVMLRPVLTVRHFKHERGAQ